MSSVNRAPLLAVVMVACVCQAADPGAAPQARLQPTDDDSGSYDIVVYGGTCAGVTATVQAARMDKSVILISPDTHLGGLSGAGLGWTDIGNKHVIGGLSREFYRRIWEHYQRADAWRYQTRASYGHQAQGAPADSGETAMWTFEPHVAEKVFNDLIAEAQVRVAHGRLRRPGGVIKDGPRITAIVADDGRIFRGKVFIDATYEGDLMAGAGVSYTVGREPNGHYGETLNGVQTKRATKNQLPRGIDPYRIKGVPASGLLPNINQDPGKEGTGDRKVQAYCFRMCLTDVPENRVPIEKPEGYDESQYEVLFRAIEAGQTGGFFKLALMPNRKTDSNNSGGISCDFIGMNHDYPEADYAARQPIVRAHEIWQKGLVWTLQNHPRVPEAIRSEYRKWGLPRDEFIDNGHWPHQLYIREARRLVGDCVMTQHHCQRRTVAEDPIGMAAYTMDSHNVQRYVDEHGHVRNEGDVQVGGFPPYPISYGAIVPKCDECTNLLVPVCLSASHIAFGSIRMEPVFMILGQSAATAAAHAIDEGVPVQEVEYGRLRERLLRDKQILEHKRN